MRPWVISHLLLAALVAGTALADARRAVAHASSGLCLQSNVVFVLAGGD